MDNRIWFMRESEQREIIYKEKIADFCCDLYNMLSQQSTEIWEWLIDFLSDYLFNNEDDDWNNEWDDRT